MHRDVLMIALLGTLTACTQSFQTEFVLINEDWNPVHLWVSGETISESNKVLPDGERTKVLREPGQGVYAYSVFAGRNGETLIERTLEVKFDPDCRQVHQVIAAYNSSGGMNVEVNRDIEKECDED